MLKTRLTFDRQVFYLAADQTTDEVLEAALDAARAGGGYVQFTEVGNRRVRVLVTPGVLVVAEEFEVAHDARDNGDLDSPYLPDSSQRQSFLDLDYYDLA